MSARTRKLLSPPLVILGVVLIVLAYLLGWSSIFSVKKIEIAGAPTTAVRAEIEKKSQIEVGQQLARVNPQSVSRKIEKLSWVKDASISRDWLSGAVAIEITPREPLAFFNSDQVPGQTIDEEGQLLLVLGYLYDIKEGFQCLIPKQKIMIDGVVGQVSQVTKVTQSCQLLLLIQALKVDEFLVLGEA